MTKTVGNEIFELGHERSMRLATEQTQVRVEQTAKVSLVFAPSLVWSKALADLLAASGGGTLISREDIADSLRLCALKLKAGDRTFVLESLAGQAVLLEQLTAGAAKDYGEAEAGGKWQWARIRLKDFQQLQKAHMRVLSAIAAMQARSS